MKKVFLLFAVLFIALFSFNRAAAQYTMLNDFTDEIDFTGAKPQNDQNLLNVGGVLYGMTNSGGFYYQGVIFKINPDGSDYTKILDFDGATYGSKPYGSLITDGTFLYGMTNEGGTNNTGVAFKIKISDNSYTKILDFDGTTYGSNPYGSFYTDGTYLYGMTNNGGVNDKGVAFKIKISDNSYTKILDFDGTSYGSNPEGSLISDGIFLYGMAHGGGTNDKGTAFKIQISDNTYTKMLDFDGTTNGWSPYGSLISDGIYLYGMTFVGGSNSYGTVFKIQINDNTYTKILDFDGATNGSGPIGSLISDENYLYGMTRGGGANSKGTAFKIQISDNSYTKILDFDGATKGSNPNGSLISDGTYLYGMTCNGGVYNSGATFKIQISNNTYTKILDFAHLATGGSYPNGALISDGTYLYGMNQSGGVTGKGTVFKLKITDNTYTKMLDFDGTTNGGYPYGSLISDGIYLYGMTKAGGINDDGTVFKIQISNNTYAKILDFDDTTNGRSPYGSLISDGIFLYGMTREGGTNDNGTVFKIKISDNTYSKILDFGVASNGAYPFGSLITDGTYLYGMTNSGGANGIGTVFEIKISDNAYTKILDFDGATNGSWPYGSLISDGTYLYGMAYGGGTNDNGTAFKIKISNNTYTKILDFDGATNGGYPYGSLISDGTYLYGMTTEGGANDIGTAFKIQISNNTYTKILDFNGITNGSYPEYTQFLIEGNYLYGTTSKGGPADLGTIFEYQIYYPEINITQNTTDIAEGGSHDFGSITSGSNSGAITFTIENTGNGSLSLSGTPIVAISGTNAADFSINQSATSATVSTGANTNFNITFIPSYGGTHTAQISIANNDANENPYIINLTGTGIKLDQTITFDALLAKTYGDADFAVTAEASSGLDVVFTSSDPSVATCSGTNGTTIKILKAGTCNIYANQAGNANNNAAPQVSQTLTVNKLAVTVTANADQTKIYGEAEPDLTYATNISLIGSDAFTGALARVAGENAGNYAINQGTLALSTNYTINYMSHDFTITKATPVILWENPADIVSGTALGATQLNAEANVDGTFEYTPDAGSILDIGDNQELSVSFAPTDALNYNSEEALAYINVLENTGINNLAESGISIYPNPTNGIVNFEFADKKIQKIMISDITGKQIIEKSEISTNETIDLSCFESGIYIIKIQTDKEIFTTKIIKE